jgi:hypothetical protein
MAIYYVRTDGSDANTGLGSSSAQAWQTITKAVGATGIAPGDTLYIAPGVYRGNFTAAFTNPTSEGQRININGDPTSSFFSGVNAGPVIITNYITNTSPSGITFSCTKDYITISNLHFVGYQLGGSPAFGTVTVFNGIYTIANRCGFYTPVSSTESYNYEFNTNIGSRGPTIQNCVFFGFLGIRSNQNTGTAYDSQTLVRDCVLVNHNNTSPTNCAFQTNTFGSSPIFGGVRVINCRIQAPIGIRQYPGYRISTSFPVVVQNCIFECQTGISSNNTGDIVETYNLFNCATERVNVTAGTGSLTRTFTSPDFSLSRVTGWANLPYWANHFLSTSQNAGINTNSDTSDFYGVTWLSPTTPTMGAVEYSSNTSVGSYIPTERNASSITIAPGSTSQSIELYLGATGLTFSTSGLAAYYVRNQSAPVAITLVTQTPTGAWTSGGFAEISSSLVPGVYRLDVPDAALAAGADDVTVVVRGASGTNGAVMTVKLSSGGLTSAQTASAVWGASPAGYSDATTFGGVVNQTDSLVNSIDTQVQDVPSQVWDQTRATHTTVGTFGQYVNAELVTPVTSAALVRMGPFEVRADGLGASDPLDIQKGAQHGVDIQCVDNNGAGIDITSATVTAKVYNSGATLVDTYSCTATYAADGRATFTIDTTVTNVPGTYTATITRTTGASDTQIFGPLRIYVRDI